MGNRSLSFWLVALSAHASDMSAWLFMAFPMVIFTLGLSQAWTALGLLVGMFLNWQFVAPKLRSMTETYHCNTLSSFFEKRFQDTSGILRIVSALVMVIFLTHYLSAGLIAMGNLLESIFDMNYYVGLSIAITVMVIYTFFGGFNTVAWIDLFQGIFLLIVIMIVPFIALKSIGHVGAISQAAEIRQIPLQLAPAGNFDSYFGIISLIFGWGLGYFGMPHIITKFMGIKHVSDMHKSKWLGMSWQLLALGASLCVGLVAIGYFPEGLEKPELVFIEMVKDLFHPFIGGFILCAVIAANLSTMDSQILVCGSLIGEDLFVPMHKNVPSDRKILWFSKFSVICVSLVALMFAFNRSATIMDTVKYSWSGLGSAFGPLVLMSLYSKSVNRYGALAGIIAGTFVVFVWPTINPMITDLALDSMIPGFSLSALAIYLVSKMTRNKAAFV
ncbi:MAG: sodium/proline symporter [Parachlamydiaceae bacterium]|nr:sodium/proline symporter [Parachlamydiaceae bacterium]